MGRALGITGAVLVFAVGLWGLMGAFDAVSLRPLEPVSWLFVLASVITFALGSVAIVAWADVHEKKKRARH